jgi:aryl-alcohol dehydrogenase-like predicted oxidoreductase
VEGSLEAPLATLLELKERGLIRHIGLSNVTAKQVADAQKMTPIVCVQNLYNIAHRADDALVDALAAQHIAWVPFFPLGGFTPLQAQELNEVAASLEATPMQVALAWLLQRAPNILLIPGTSSRTHLAENIAAAELVLPAEALRTLDNIATAHAPDPSGEMEGTTSLLNICLEKPQHCWHYRSYKWGVIDDRSLIIPVN